MNDEQLKKMIRHFMGYVECGEGCTLKFWQDDATKDFHAYRDGHQIAWSDKGFDDLLSQMMAIYEKEAANP